LVEHCPRVLELHRDEVGGSRTVAGRDGLKGCVQRLGRPLIPDRRQQSLRRQPIATRSKTIRMPLQVGCASGVPANVSARDRKVRDQA
jgi:hypothetical protein